MLDKARIYSVYKLTCVPTGKIYIGVTSQKLTNRWRNGKAYHGALKADIDKYGWNNFTKEVLMTGLNSLRAAAWEKHYISLFGNRAELYNATCGGEVQSDEAISRKSIAMTGRTIFPEVRERMSEARKGIAFSEEHLKNLSQSHKGQAGYWKGKKRDESTRQIISEKLSKPIKCVETGEVFRNLREASEKTGFPMSSISKWCNGVKPKKCQYTFERMV